MSESNSTKLTTEQNVCPWADCAWHLREVPMFAAPGYFAVVQRCGRCHHLSLALYRVSLGSQLRARLVGVVRLLGRDEGSARQALGEFKELGADEREALLTVGKLLSA